jgi:hypothetical protein
VEQKANKSYRQFYRQLTFPAVTISDLQRREAPLSTCNQNGIRVNRRLFWKGSDVQPPEADKPYWRPIKYSLFPPLGLATLAAYLSPDDCAVIVDEHVEPLTLDDAPELVVIQVYIYQRLSRLPDCRPLPEPGSGISRLRQSAQDEFDFERAQPRSNHGLCAPPVDDAAEGGGADGTPPKRRSLRRNSPNAASRSVTSKSGHMRSVNTSSA